MTVRRLSVGYEVSAGSVPIAGLTSIGGRAPQASAAAFEKLRIRSERGAAPGPCEAMTTVAGVFAVVRSKNLVGDRLERNLARAPIPERFGRYDVLLVPAHRPLGTSKRRRRRTTPLTLAPGWLKREARVRPLASKDAGLHLSLSPDFEPVPQGVSIARLQRLASPHLPINRRVVPMRLFTCPDCGSVLYFENLSCSCGADVAYDPQAEGFVTDFRACDNRAAIGCNWVAEARFCRACATTEIIPDLADGNNFGLWSEAEAAKRWVLTNLGRWGWFTSGDGGAMPVFHLLSERTARGDAQVTMGHASGLITINVVEADPAERVRRREELGEPYRTMIGHYRHELAHFLFERLCGREGFKPAFRDLFGDVSADYGAALARHYGNGPPPDWRDRHVTGYAASHPHEDWAESTAHLLHLTDIVDSADATGLAAGPDPYAAHDAQDLISRGAALGLALNHVNRSMGLHDLYPFVLAPPVREKLAFVYGHLSRGPGA